LSRHSEATVDDSAGQFMGFSYVYILQSINQPEHHYVGHTDDLHDRLKRHNAGEVITAYPLQES
jgi:predicted GIY-YIG superfamily endonuclease